MLANVGTDMFLQENKLYNVVLICLSQHCTRKNYLCNVGPQSTNNFAQKNNLQFCLDISGPTLHKEITCVMLVHG